MWYYNYWSTGECVCVCVCVCFLLRFGGRWPLTIIWSLGRSSAELRSIFYLGNECCVFLSLFYWFFHVQSPYVRERGVFMWTPQRKRSLQHTLILFMLADTRRHRRLQNAHIGIFSRFLDLTCTGPWDLTYEHMLFNSETCWMHWAHLYIRFTSHRFTSA